MTRGGRRRVLREDAVAPVLVMGVILTLWWVGARLVSEFRVPPDGPAATRIEPADSSAPDRPGSGPATPGAPTARSHEAEAGVPPPLDTAAPTTAAVVQGAGVSPQDIDILRARRLIVPVEGIDPDALTSNYHQPRGDGSHEAMDIMSPRGTPVRAVEGGRIEKLFMSEKGGLTIYQFDPSESYCYYYAHLDRYASTASEGKVVAAGEVIGFVGSTGNASPDAPHLHFAVFKLGPEPRWWQGLPIDPYLVLR